MSHGRFGSEVAADLDRRVICRIEVDCPAGVSSRAPPEAL